MISLIIKDQRHQQQKSEANVYKFQVRQLMLSRVLKLYNSTNQDYVYVTTK